MSRPVLLALALLASATSAAQDDAPLGLSDLAAEHEALSGKLDVSAPPRPATFRDLWERPEEYRGVRVRVAGRVVRTFRQDAVGSFPALVEAWIEEPSGDLLCAVFPAPARDAGVAKGASVAFTGTYLRRVRYRAEGDRLAPLIVGPVAPSVEKPAAADADEDRPAPISGWPGPLATLGLFVGLALVGGMLAWRTATAPTARRGRRAGRADAAPDRAPEFLDPESDDGEGR